MHHDDGTPVRRRPSGVAEEDEYSCDRHMSVSCPCIDNFVQSPVTSAASVAAAAAAPLAAGCRGPCAAGGGGPAAINGKWTNANGALHLQPTPVKCSAGFPRVNSAPVTPMAADCVDMTAVSPMLRRSVADDANEPLIKINGGAGDFGYDYDDDDDDDDDRDGAITFV